MSVEEALALSDHDREDHQPELVDQTRIECCRRNVCVTYGRSVGTVGHRRNTVHDVKADGPMVRMSESFRDGGENREA